LTRTDGHRKYAERFPFDTADGVKKLLKQSQKIADGRFERGDFAACDILIDLRSAIIAAELSDMELRVILGLYVRDGYYKDLYVRYGLERWQLYDMADKACEKIAGVYRKWNYGKQ
jgi:hypothetical protein